MVAEWIKEIFYMYIREDSLPTKDELVLSVMIRLPLEGSLLREISLNFIILLMCKIYKNRFYTDLT